MWPMSIHTVDTVIMHHCVFVFCSPAATPLKVTAAEKMWLTYWLNNKRSVLCKNTKDVSAATAVYGGTKPFLTVFMLRAH